MRKKFVFSIVLASLGAVLPGSAQMRTTSVLLKVAVPTVIAGHTLQPGTYRVNSWSDPNVVSIQRTGNAQTSMFVLSMAVSDGSQFRGALQPPVESRMSTSGIPTITSIYFPAQDRAYYFSPRIEERSHVSHGQQASASPIAR